MTKTITRTIPSQMEMRKQLGLLTISDAAKELGMSRRLLHYHQSQGNCLKPTTRIEGEKRLYYTESDLEVLKEHFKDQSR